MDFNGNIVSESVTMSFRKSEMNEVNINPGFIRIIVRIDEESNQESNTLYDSCGAIVGMNFFDSYQRWLWSAFWFMRSGYSLG